MVRKMIGAITIRTRLTNVSPTGFIARPAQAAVTPTMDPERDTGQDPDRQVAAVGGRARRRSGTRHWRELDLVVRTHTPRGWG
jgi:hypothetical protein